MWQEGLGDFHPFPGMVCEEGKQVKGVLTGKSSGAHWPWGKGHSGAGIRHFLPHPHTEPEGWGDSVELRAS